MKKPSKDVRASALVFAVIAVLVLSMMVGEVVRVVTVKYMNVFHTASWQESLLAAESGIDLGMVELRKNITNPGSAFQSPWVAATTGTSNSGVFSTSHAGEGGTNLNIQVTVDALSQLVDAQGWQYYRIRSTGSTIVPGVARATDEKRDSDLRKLSLKVDRLTGLPIDRPKATRRIEIIAKPMSPFNAAILARGLVDLTDHNIVIDSYDSRDPAKSTNGQYDPAKRQQNGDVATDGNLINAGNAYIYGDVATNAGTVTDAANVTGQQRTDFYQDVPSVNSPTWYTFNANPTAINNTTTIAASPVKGSSASRYKLSQISLNGPNVLTVTGDPSGAPTYVEIWVTGDISISGQGQIMLGNGVQASIYFAGDASISGNGITNGTSPNYDRPGNAILYGIKPTDGSTQTVSLSGNAAMEGAVYAPDANVTIDGGGTKGTFSGSVVGSTVKMTGVTTVHYDEAMTARGNVTDYRIVSWFEDTSRGNVW